ncbi:MAG: hypothetical protein PHW82_12290 [Bacteroidales bacterium]|nr:hypothetical protein [Bacteroidales bacterium]
MKFKFLTFIIIVGFVSSLCACNTNSENKKETESKENIVVIEKPSPIDTFSYQGYNTVARILAGKMPNDTVFLSDIVASSAFKSHKSIFNNIWTSHKDNLDIITEWSKQNITNQDTVFYPFGGPDFNYLDAFFPDSKLCMLIGLEKGGVIPFSDEKSISNASEILNMVNSSVQSNLNWSFFRTISMRKDLAGYLEGTLPIIMMFMSRHDYDIVNVNPVFLNNQGLFEYTDKDNVFAYTLQKDFNDSYEIIYKKPEESEMRKLYYFSMDVGDTVVNKKSFSLMMENYFNGKTTFLKAASYLLDMEGFDFIKEEILDNSKEIVTGPSGMQHRFFNDLWKIDYYGSYVGPIRLFYDRQQNDLKDAYKNNDVKDLPFTFDYHQTYCSLIIARKK